MFKPSPKFGQSWSGGETEAAAPGCDANGDRKANRNCNVCWPFLGFGFPPSINYFFFVVFRACGWLFFFLIFCPTRIIFMGKIRNLKGAVYVCKIKLEAARPSNSFLWFLFLKTLSCWNVAYFKGPLFSRQENKSLFCGNLSFNDFLLNLRISENICSLIINLSRLLFFYH